MRSITLSAFGKSGCLPSGAARCVHQLNTLRPGLCTGRAAWQRMCSACAAHVQLACILAVQAIRLSCPASPAQVRALTAGEVRGAPLAYDALCGRAAPQDPPLLLMFMLMTRLSWCASSRPRLVLLHPLTPAPVLVRNSVPTPGSSAVSFSTRARVRP